MAAKKATPAAEPVAETQAYRVVSSLRHNGSRYAVGDRVELTADEFARLSAAGVVTDQPALS